MVIVVFWAVTPCSLVGGYRRFGGTYRLIFLVKYNGTQLSKFRFTCFSLIMHSFTVYRKETDIGLDMSVCPSTDMIQVENRWTDSDAVWNVDICHRVQK
jgi:hypothetical protein